MNALELQRKKYRKQKAKETLFGILFGFGLAMAMAGGIGLIHGYHPVTLGMVIVGLLITASAYITIK